MGVNGKAPRQFLWGWASDGFCPPETQGRRRTNPGLLLSSFHSQGTQGNCGLQGLLPLLVTQENEGQGMDLGASHNVLLTIVYIICRRSLALAFLCVVLLMRH